MFSHGLNLSTILAALFSLSSVIAVQSPLQVVNSTVSFDVSYGAKKASPLNRQLMSLSIEFDNYLDFFGDVNSTNLFSRQLIQNVQDISGLAPMIRIGGDTADSSVFCEECASTLNATFVAGSTEAVSVVYSKAFFQVLEENLGPDQQYIVGLNFASGNYTIAQQELYGALKYLNQSSIVAYELGNEPNYYTITGHKSATSGWDVVEYATQIVDWYQLLQESTEESLTFQAGSMVGPPSAFGDWTIVQLAQMQVPQTAGNVIISSHTYPRDICTPANAALVNLEYYMNHLETVNYASDVEGEIAVAKSLGAVYHIGEAGTVACHGLDGVSNTMGAALWEIDYALTSATMGVDRLFFHNGEGGFYYSTWEPLAINGTPAYINPTYFSMLFVADIVSDLTSPSIFRLAHLDTFDLAHYAIYDDDSVLQKMVILNTAYFNGTGERPENYLDVTSVFGNEVQVKRLTAPSAIATSSVTWANQTVDTTGSIVGDVSIESVADGLIRMAGGEAVIVSI